MAHRKQKDPYAPTQRRPGAQRPERLPTGPGRARELAISGEPQTCGDARDARRGLIAQQSADKPVPAKEESKPVPVHCPPRLRLSWVGRPRFSRARATRAHVHLCGGMFVSVGVGRAVDGRLCLLHRLRRAHCSCLWCTRRCRLAPSLPAFCVLLLHCAWRVRRSILR